MSKKNAASSDARVEASRRNGTLGGRPSEFGPKVKRRELLLTQAGDEAATSKAAALGCSVAQAFEIAIRQLDVAAYLAEQKTSGTQS